MIEKEIYKTFYKEYCPNGCTFSIVGNWKSGMERQMEFHLKKCPNGKVSRKTKKTSR